jgi:phosphoesterase RecJ-like protein
MGSSLGLYNYLIKLKHKVTVVTPNDYPSFLFWLPGNKKVVNHLLQSKSSANTIAKADVIFCLDFNALKRIDKLGELVANATAKKIMIDHHPQPDTFANYTLHDVKACSTSELIFDFIQLMKHTKLVDKNIASCLYTGIMTDTGSFRYPATTAKTHTVVASLIKAGAENAEIHNRIYDNNTESRLKLVGYSLSEKLKVFQEYQTAYFHLTAAELHQHNYQKGDTEGIVNYALSIKGIRFAAFFVERDGIIKISFRSKGSFDVNAFARKYFNGGGHVNAAGGMSDLAMTQTLEKFEQLLLDYKKQLNKK